MSGQKSLRAMLTLGVCGAALLAADAAAAQSSDNTIEAIVVTAQRRELEIKRMPRAAKRALCATRRTRSAGRRAG